MTYCRTQRLLLAVLLAGVVGGCIESRSGLHYLGDANLEHYKDVATKIDYPAVCDEPNPVALATSAPRRIRHLSVEDPSVLWNLSLMEAQRIALSNSTIIRERDQFLSPRNPLMTNPEAVASSYDPAIQESDVRFGSRGVEAALSDFDAQFTTSMLWGRNEQVQNNLFLSGGLPTGATLKDETGAFQQRLQKQFADSGSFAVIHNWNYSGNNVPTRLFSSVYEGFVRAEYRRPLWARSGTSFTRVFGATGSASQGVAQGVVISRINNDITIADFELSVQNLLRDVETSYWDLSLAYRAYHAEKISVNSAIGTWREVKARLNQGLKGGSAADEAQARDNLFESQERMESALADVYSVEGQFRRLLGLPVNDGRIIRPADEPTMAEYLPDWQMALVEGLTRRIELRKQKWQIKSLELQLTESKSLTKPELDFVSAYQVNGFGDTLWTDGSDNDGVTPHGLHSGFGTLTQGDQTGWNLGFEFRMPIGFRAGHAQVRNYELRLARARAALAAQELEVSHELSSAFQSLDRWYKTAQTNFNRRRAAETRVQAFELEYEAGRGSLDLLLRSQISLAQAEIAYFRSLTEYNKAITDLEFRKGTLLEHDNVFVAEALWDAEAYPEAMRRAWARSHAFDNPYLHTEPQEFVDGDPMAGMAYVPLSDPMSQPGYSQPMYDDGMPANPNVPPAPPTDEVQRIHAPVVPYEQTPVVPYEPVQQSPVQQGPVQQAVPQVPMGFTPSTEYRADAANGPAIGGPPVSESPVPVLSTQPVLNEQPASEVDFAPVKQGAWKAREQSEEASPAADVTWQSRSPGTMPRATVPSGGINFASGPRETSRVELTSGSKLVEPQQPVKLKPSDLNGPVITPYRPITPSTPAKRPTGRTEQARVPNMPPRWPSEGQGVPQGKVADQGVALPPVPEGAKVRANSGVAAPVKPMLPGASGKTEATHPASQKSSGWSPRPEAKAERLSDLPAYQWKRSADVEDGWKAR